ncbi:hypothetical protein N2152v2_010889 [Parachlorella kessleri]
MKHLSRFHNPQPAAMPTGPLSQLTRLIPASQLGWRGAIHTLRRLRVSEPYLSQGLCCSASAQLEGGRTLTDLDAPEGRRHPVFPPRQQQAQVHLDAADSPDQSFGSTTEATHAPAPAAAAGARSDDPSAGAPGITAGAAGTVQGGPQRTGAFQKLPMVAPAKELLESALRRAGRVGANKKLKNEAQKAKNRAARQLDALLKELCVPLGKYVKEFPPVTRLHPFERALLELTVGPGTYERVLGRVDGLRKSTVQVGKAYAARCSKAVNKKEAVELQQEGFERLEATFTKGAYAVDELKEVAKSLRKLPVVDPDLPTVALVALVALVGAPNVGKSSLVQLLSSGLPEVQNYPFTTRSIKMGHFYVEGRRHQVTDTPGLLNRPEEERNAMERLTLASLQHLPTAVLFVADLTGECGTTLADQWRIRHDLRERFPDKPWIDVLSKADMLEEEFDAADELAAQQGQHPAQPQHAGSHTAPPADPVAAQAAPSLAQSVAGTSSSIGSDSGGSSSSTGLDAGSAETGAAVAAGLDLQQQAGVAAERGLSSEKEENSSSSSMSLPADPAAAAAAAAAAAPTVSLHTAVEFAAAVSGALRVSSLTGDGIEHLKGAMLAMLEDAQLAKREGLEGVWAEAAGDQQEQRDELDELIYHADEEHREHEAYMYD